MMTVTAFSISVKQQQQPKARKEQPMKRPKPDLLIMQSVEPQPNIQGSYIGDGEKWHYCEMGDMDRVCAKQAPQWKTIINPFGAQGDLLKNGEEWVWVAPHNNQ